MTPRRPPPRSRALLATALGGSLALACAFALVSVLRPASAGTPATAAATFEAGKVRFVKDAGRHFDRFTRAPSRKRKRFMRTRYQRMVVFSPYFDRRLRWFRRGWAYRDLYGIFPRSRAARRHPEWILRGRTGNRLYLPFDCSGDRCPQYAGDITNPAFRRAWIRRARRVLRRGYAGLYIDDVNMIRRVGLGTGREVTPISPRTGRRIRRGAWRRAVVRFTLQIRRALPRTEIVHNVIWFSPRPRDRLSRGLVRSADVIALERGVNDAGLTGFGGRFGLTTFLDYVDWIHRRGRVVKFDEHAPSPQQREYGLAGYLLINNGRDFLSSEPTSTPRNFWRGYRVNLGIALGRRYRWRGLLRRDFEYGMVLLNQPGRAARTVRLPGTYESADRRRRLSRVNLGPANGAVLVRP